ncbi:hypothetical protein E3N88_22788 [Mikania micrantha]|uniref:Reverse transcriptase Ty1/copia-type domain-containing protein n=1 Tax=Mikania micrantha TaxID=192012 RepID=A0A5N6ND43_9ASTR|nr:hypothetical protein E3N88_22788 [Mikania micrantha]
MMIDSDEDDRQPDDRSRHGTSPTPQSAFPVTIQPQNQPHTAFNTHPVITRSKAHHTLVFATISPIPKSYAKAFADPHWLQAMQAEFNALQENDTRELVPRPTDRPVICCMWIFRHKFKSDGSLGRCKARLVVNGKPHTVGID